MNEHAWALLVRALADAGQLQQAQRTHDLATKQFYDDALPLNGELKSALASATAEAQRPALQSFSEKHRATLAVLPCQSFQDSQPPTAVHHRITEALHTAATANRSCAVLAWSITSRAAKAGVDARNVGSNIGADLILDARLHESQVSYRLSLELITVSDGTCLFNWTNEFDRCDLDTLAESVSAFYSARFEIDLQMALIALAHTKPPNARGLWDEYFLALPRIYTASGHDPVESLALLQDVLDREPSMGAAAAAAAWVRTTHPQFNQSSKDIAVTASLARRAIELCQDDTFVMSLAAIVIASTERDLDTALDLVQRARMFNPYSILAYLALGVVEHYRGNHADALALLEQPARTLDTEPVTFAINAYSALCCYFLGQPEQGLQLARKSCGRNPGFVVGRRALTLCLVACGKRVDAHAQAQQLQALDPSEYLRFYQTRSPYRRASDIQAMCDDLRTAGVAEEPVVTTQA